MERFDRNSSLLWTAGLLVGGFAFLYLNLFYLPSIPIHLVIDGNADLLHARRMLEGGTIYKDFFQSTLPGTQVLYFLLFKTLGVRAWIPNALAIVLGLALALIVLLISKSIIPGKAAYLPAVLFLIVPFRSHLSAQHSWWSTLLALAAMATLIEKITGLRMIAAGVLCGASACFTQWRGMPAAIGIALFLLWLARRKVLPWRNLSKAQLYLWGGFISTVAAFNVYFAAKAGLITFFHATVASGFQHWRSVVLTAYSAYMSHLPRFHPWYRLPALAIWGWIFLLVPLIYLVFFARIWDDEAEQPDEPWDRLMLLSLVGFAMFMGVAHAPSWLRLCVVSPPAIILFVWYLNLPGRLQRIRVVSVAALALAVAIGECTERRLRWRQELTLPVGRTAILDPVQAEETTFLLRGSKPGEFLFNNSDLDYLLDLRNPTPLANLNASGPTSARQVAEIIDGLKTRQANFVFWPIALDVPPGDSPPATPLGPLRDFLRTHYHTVRVFSNSDAIWALGAPPPPPVTQSPPQAPEPAQSQ